MVKEEAVSFSPREMEVLALAWQCMENEPKINMAKLAELTGYTVGSASVTLGKIKRKMKLHVEACGSNANTPTPTPHKATPKTPKSGGKRAAPRADDNDASPKKKSKGGAISKTRDEDDDDEEFAKVKVKKEEGKDLLRGAEHFLQQQGGKYEYNMYSHLGDYHDAV